MTTINMGALSSAINNKLDRDLNNLDIANTDIIVAKQDPSAANNYTWYRLYKSGWVEQGCCKATEKWYTLPIPMADTNYYIAITAARNNADAVYGTNIRTDRLSTTQIYPYYSSSTINGTWEVKGIAA